MDKNTFGNFFHRVGPYVEVLVLVMPNCHQRELSPVKLKRWPVLRKQDLFKKCDLNFASLLEKFCECIANVFSAMGSLSLKLERLRILEKPIFEKIFPEISNSFGNKTFFFF